MKPGPELPLLEQEIPAYFRDDVSKRLPPGRDRSGGAPAGRAPVGGRGADGLRPTASLIWAGADGAAAHFLRRLQRHTLPDGIAPADQGPPLTNPPAKRVF